MVEETGFASPTNIAWRGDVGVVEYGGGDRGMVAMFYSRPMQNPAKSSKEGRPYFEDKIFVRIAPPGERLNIVDREVTESDKRRWPTQWHQFQQRKEQQPDGTPIDMLFPEYPAVAATLRAHGVSTIEQCADLSAPAIDNIGMGSQRYVNAAAKYLEMASKGKATTQMRHELEERDRKIKILERTVDDLKGLVEELRGKAMGAPDLAQIQAMVAGVMQRPVSLPGPQFDAQSAMINSTSATSQITQANKNRKRSRVRVGR
jgi:hypothetical protein